MDTQLKENLCITCTHHRPLGTLDDVPNECYPCVWHKANHGEFLNYEPDLSKILSKKIDADLPEVTEEEEEEWVRKEMGWQGGSVVYVDNVNSPSHYTQGGIETIDFIEAKLGKEGTIAYCVGNSIKYLSRWRDKGGVEDLKKSRWYQDYAIELMEENV